MADPTIIASAIASINLLISAASMYFSDQRARPEINKRNLCQRLCKLRGALMSIADTGNAIGDLLNTNTFHDENDPTLQELIKLLQSQNRNIRDAQSEFIYLARLFEIKQPELHEIRLHLRGKSDRIDMIYAAVGTADLKRSLGENVETWEVNEILGKPSDLTPSVSRGRAELTIRKPDDIDHDFAALVDAIEPLTKFIGDCCESHNLV